MLVESISIPASNPASTATDGFPSKSPSPADGKKSEKNERSVAMPDMQVMAEDLQNNLKVLHDVNLQFSVHQASGQVIVAVTDKETGELIREIPSEEMLKLSAKLEEMMGMIFDQKI
jgi:flagellar protein FlaG